MDVTTVMVSLEPWLQDPRLAMVAFGLVDVAVVAVLFGLVGRIRRERDAVLAVQRTTLERLRDDLKELVGDAEQRAHALDERLATREMRLRRLLREITGVEAAGPAAFRRSAGSEGGGRRVRPDAAEARLREDLERAAAR
jgi:hypothetical protein